MNFFKSRRNRSIAEKYSELLGSTTILRQENEALRIMVMGEFNSGKSSVCNALLGRSILPTDVFETTATINRIRYGLKEEYLVIGHDDKIILRDSNLETLQKFNADCGTFENIKWIDIYSPLIPQGIELVDTPGFNDTNAVRNQTFLSIEPSADVIVFVCDANQALKGSELPYINKYFLSALSRVYFVFNHADGLKNLQRLTVTSASVCSSVQKMINDAADIFKSSEYNEVADGLRQIDLRKHIYFVSALLSSGGLDPSKIDNELHKTIKDDFERFKAELYSLIETKDLIRRESQTRLTLLQLKDRFSNVCKTLEAMNLSRKQKENLKTSLMERLSRQEQKYLTIQKRMLNLPKTVGEYIDKECKTLLSHIDVKLRAGDDSGGVYIQKIFQQELQTGLEKINSGVKAMVQNDISASLELSLTNNDLSFDTAAVPSGTQRNSDYMMVMGSLSVVAMGIGYLCFGFGGIFVASIVGRECGQVIAAVRQKKNIEEAYKSILNQAITTLTKARNDTVKRIQDSICRIEEEILKATDNLQWNVLELAEYSLKDDPVKQKTLSALKTKLELAIKDCRMNLIQN